jgi:ketopantoate reductase
MRSAVVGTGAVGSYFGGRLALAGEDVVFLARGAHLHAIRSTDCISKAWMVTLLFVQHRQQVILQGSVR